MHRFGFGFGYWIGPLICFLLVVGGLVLDILALVSLQETNERTYRDWETDRKSVV